MHKHPLLTAALLSLTAAQVSAHDIWLTTASDGPNIIHAIVNHGHPGDRILPVEEKLYQFDILEQGQASRTLLDKLSPAVQNGIPVLYTPDFTLKGDALLSAQYDNGFFVETKDHGFRNTSKLYVPDAKKSESSTKYAKTLVHIDGGDPAVFQTVLGQPLELVPLNNPFALKSGEKLKVRALFKGKPVKDVGVIELSDGVTPKPKGVAKEDVPGYKTDSDGVAEIPISKSGLQILVMNQEVAGVTPTLGDIDLYNATLAFVMP